MAPKAVGLQHGRSGDFRYDDVSVFLRINQLSIRCGTICLTKPLAFQNSAVGEISWEIRGAPYLGIIMQSLSSPIMPLSLEISAFSEE